METVKKKRGRPSRALGKSGKCQNGRDGFEHSSREVSADIARSGKHVTTNESCCNIASDNDVTKGKPHAVPGSDLEDTSAAVDLVVVTHTTTHGPVQPVFDSESDQDSIGESFSGEFNVSNGVKCDEDSPTDRLSIQNLREVRNALYPARLKWYDIGIELSMDPTLLEAIKSKHSSNDPSDLLTNMLSEYLKRAYPRPTWGSLVNALNQDAVAQGQVAEDIERAHVRRNGQEADHSDQSKAKFSIPSSSDSMLYPTALTKFSDTILTDSDSLVSCSPISQSNITSQNNPVQSGESNSSASHSVKHKTFQCLCGSCNLSKYMTQGCPKEGVENKQYPYLDTKGLSKPAREDLEAKLDSEVDKMIESFADLSHSIIESLEMRGITPIKLARCALSIGTYKSHKILKPFSEKDSAALVQAQSLDEIFIILFRHMSFFNYELLQFVIGKLGTESDRNALDSYTAEFETFCQRSVFEVPPNIYMNVHGCEVLEDSKPYAVKLEGDWKLTVGDVKKAQRRIAALLDIQPSTLLLCNVHEGCVRLEFSLPKEVYDEVVPLTPQQGCDLQLYDITQCELSEDNASEEESDVAEETSNYEQESVKVQMKLEPALSLPAKKEPSLEELCPNKVESVHMSSHLQYKIDSVIKTAMVDDEPGTDGDLETKCKCNKYKKRHIVLTSIGAVCAVVMILILVTVIPLAIIENQNEEIMSCLKENVTTVYGEYMWMRTLANENHVIPCEYGGIEGLVNATARRTCDERGEWNDAVYDDCLTLTTSLLCNLTNFKLSLEVSIDESLDTLLTAVTQANVNDQSSNLNVEKISAVFQKLAVNCTANNATLSQCALNFEQLSAITSVLDLLQQWNNITLPRTLIQNTNELLSSYLEGLNIQDSENFSTATFSHENLTFTGLKVNYSKPTETSAISFTESDRNGSTGFRVVYGDVDTYEPYMNVTSSSSITVSPEVFNQLRNKSDEESKYIVIIFGMYNSTTLFPLRNNSALFASENVSIESFSVYTPLLSATIFGSNGNLTLDEDSDIIVVFNFEAEESQDVQCILWDETVSDEGDWTTDGCNTTFSHQLSVSSTVTVICRCNKFSTFGIIVNATKQSSPIDNGPALSSTLVAATYISSGVSIVELVLTMFTFLFFKSNRVKVISKFHVQLFIALIGMILTFCIGIDRSKNEAVCTTFSCLIHYFTLASVFWMGAEALLLFINFGFEVYRRRFITWKLTLVMSLISWGLPVVFIVISLTTLATGSNYLVVTGNDFEQCFIGDVRMQIALFWLPITIIMTCNIVAFVAVMRNIIKHRNDIKPHRLYRTSIPKQVIQNGMIMIIILSLTILFGLSWLFLTLSIDNRSIIFRWFFISSNTLQSTILFFFFCVRVKKNRRRWINLLKGNCTESDTDSQKTTESQKTKSFIMRTPDQ